MKKSLTTKISVVFCVAIGLVTVLFLTFGYLQIDNALKRMETSQLNSIDYLVNLQERDAFPRDIEGYFNNFNLKIVSDKNTIKNVLTSKRIMFVKQTSMGDFFSIRYKNNLYLHISTQPFNLTLESIGTKNINDPLWIGYFITIGLLISLWASVMKNLRPLTKLSKNIKKFAGGNMDLVQLNLKGDDEITEVANEFDNAVTKIKELIRSRQLFLRTIMHELKTPISKGRIVSEMVNDEVQKNRLIDIFERLEILINEFAKVEQLLTKSYTLNYQEYHFSLILEQTKDILMLDDWDSKVKVDIVEDAIINVDFQFFSLAIKNLIDNALKYSSDKKVNITCDKDRICISNKGEPMPVGIEHYKQAFVRNKNEKVTGMGLGLYIIDKICSMHKFKLEYFYSGNSHHFCIVFKDDKATK
ncbi:MAG: ArsS family sensor histidine kinase [Campylobacter sp.]|nr:ArsS family sensor histidine kinase [Campylobacter sp.]